MVVLADVHGVLIGLAVAWVVAHWLHANLLAVADHDVAVFARGGRCLHHLESVRPRRHAVL